MGLVVNNPGGGAGWLARRLFPRAATGLYLRYIRIARASAHRRRIGEFVRAATTPWFSHVEIETLNRCNGECAFCPVNGKADPRRYAKMPEALFLRILDQLGGIGYRGYLGLFSNNEPLLDDRLEGFLEAARRRLPRCAINLSTNGTLLSVDRLRRLLPSLDRLVVNNYAAAPVLAGNLGEVAAFLRTGEGQAALAERTVVINLRSGKDALSSRAGSSPNRKPPAKPPASPCSLPFSQLVVRPDGKVSLCCSDALGQATLGDLAAQTLAGVWLGDAAARVRTAMLERGRMGHPLCRRCDFVKDRVD
ncbi:MAG: SPASM domain-containing protein [Planctomycetota bacterium]|jgi:hypothetical protein|nr:SPASM domain-containing protein [Planctomycetota bacterium]